MMWGNLQIDVFWYGILVCDLLATPLLITTSQHAKFLYTSAPVALILWFCYERAIDIHLLAIVPIRLDIPIVVLASLFPTFASAIHHYRQSRVTP